MSDWKHMIESFVGREVSVHLKRDCSGQRVTRSGSDPRDPASKQSIEVVLPCDGIVEVCPFEGFIAVRQDIDPAVAAATGLQAGATALAYLPVESIAFVGVQSALSKPTSQLSLV